MAKVVGARVPQMVRVGRSMGLAGPAAISTAQQRRSYITVIRRNWHLLPYEQLLELLGWTPAQLAFSLREDDFLFVKLGNLKPLCPRLQYAPPTLAAEARARQMATLIRATFGTEVGLAADPLFGFIERLCQRPDRSERPAEIGQFSPRYCYSYFALYGDPLSDKTIQPYPDGYLAQLSALGVNGVWLQGVLQKLAPFPWEPEVSVGYKGRLAALKDLVKRAARARVGVYLYLNEPRSMPLAFFNGRESLRGTVEGEYAALCTSHPEVQAWMTEAVRTICQAVPDLAGFFTISASENFTHCWSHHQGGRCPRCSQRPPADVVAEANRLVQEGIQKAGHGARLLVWDWGWRDDWVEGIIGQLPAEASLLSVSEWGIPIHRGGVPTNVGEYSISTIGPGERARGRWELAKKRGLRTLAKIQAGNTWELSAVPYIPALQNVAQHIANLADAGVDGLMLGWTLGGYPSPNLEIVMEIARTKRGVGSGQDSVSAALEAVATRRFGAAIAPAVVKAWREFSAAFSQFPFDGGLVYNAPMQYGPSNLLWASPTKYRATMIGFPYDDFAGWRGPYPPETFIQQFETVANGFDHALQLLRQEARSSPPSERPEQARALDEELNVAEAAAIHFRTTANQARFVRARDALAVAPDATARARLREELEGLLRAEADLARRLYAIQLRDSRIGFEATNHYYYVPLDLAEKVLNCHDLLARGFPEPK